jgi:hypothetical protein
MLLIVEIKVSSQDRLRDESQLKSYMLHMRCPVGLFIVPEEIGVFRDSTPPTLNSLSVESVHFHPRRAG